MDLISASSMRSMEYTSSPKLKRNSTLSLKFWTIPEKQILSMTLTIPYNSHTNPQQLHIPRNRLPYILCRKTAGSFPSSKPVEIQNSSEFRKYPNTTVPWITSWVNPSFLQIAHLQVVFLSFASSKKVHFLLSIESRVLIYKMILKYRHGVYLYGCFQK